MQRAWEVPRTMLGLGAESLNVWQISTRAAVVFVAALALVRLGEKRFLGKSTAFDVYADDEEEDPEDQGEVARLHVDLRIKMRNLFRETGTVR